MSETFFGLRSGHRPVSCSTSFPQAKMHVLMQRAHSPRQSGITTGANKLHTASLDMSSGTDSLKRLLARTSSTVTTGPCTPDDEAPGVRFSSSLVEGVCGSLLKMILCKNGSSKGACRFSKCVNAGTSGWRNPRAQSGAHEVRLHYVEV